MSRSIDQEDCPPSCSQISSIGKCSGQPLAMFQIVARIVILTYQYLPLFRQPAPRPTLIRPTQTERKIRLSRAQYFVEWPPQQPSALEPVVVVAESRNPMGPCQLSLGFPRFGYSQIIKSQISRQMWLVVTLE